MEREKHIADRKVGDVRHLVVPNASTVRPDQSLDDLLRIMIDDPCTRHVYVVDGAERLVGVVRMFRVVEYLFPFTSALERSNEMVVAEMPQPSARTAADLMNPEPLYVDEKTRVDEMARILLREKITELPVVDADHRLVGQINMYEVIAGHLNDTENEHHLA